MIERQRDIENERALTDLAGQAVGLDRTVADSLTAFAEQRARPGPIVERDFVTEALEELADCRNYLIWGAQQAAARTTEDGEPNDSEYAQLLTALSHVLRAWEQIPARSLQHVLTPEVELDGDGTRR